MTIFTSNFARHLAPFWPILAAIVLLFGALLLWIVPSNDQRLPLVRTVRATDQGETTLRSVLQANFDLASRGGHPRKSRMKNIPRNNSAGLLCSPATLDRNRSAFHIVLPAAPTDRKGILAALAPDGSLRIIYISYGLDTDPEDLIIPSRSIDWERVRTRNQFVVEAREFEALRPGENRPEPLFRQSGIYQFALLNGDRELLKINRAPFWVVAGCVVRWQP